MVFSSIIFLFYFLAPLLFIYYIVPKKYKNIILFIASIIFYAWGEPKYVFLMLFSAAFNYRCGIWIGTAYRKKAALAINIFINIGLLVFFKYTNFILSTAGYLTKSEIPQLNILLPIGISFYTFQALSYTIDVYRGKTAVQKSFLNFGLYLSLFPQLIAGPIVRYNDVASQLRRRIISYSGIVSGFTRFSAGLCKKVFIANAVGKIWTMVSGFDIASLPMSLAWLGIISYTIQIYFDFSGYSDMAIGLGKMLGFDFLENFNYPYKSKSITEFWRRWHMSLSSWFKEYVYIPLGGNRVSKFRSYLNILIVWMLTGLWHGASWNFVLWGLYFAALLIIEKLFLKKFLERSRVISHIYALFFIILGWAIFAVEDINSVGLFIKAMFSFGNIGADSVDFLYTLSSYALLIIAAAVISTGLPKKIYDRIIPEKLSFLKYICAVIGFIICVAYLVDDTFNPFLYFRF